MPDDASQPDDRIVNHALSTGEADQAEAAVRDALAPHGLVVFDFVEVTPDDTSGPAADLLLKLGEAAVNVYANGGLLVLVPLKAAGLIPGSADDFVGAAWTVVRRG